MDRYFIGDYYVSDGGKPIDTKVKMPIEWLVLEETEDGKSLLLSKDVLDWEFYGDRGEISWRKSYMFHYLYDLFQTLFSQEEKDIIVEGKYGFLFLLSEEEIIKYLPNEEKRRAVMYFVYKDDDGEIETSMEHYAYWLRAREDCDWRDVPGVSPLGGFISENSEADEMGVRIAMWVDTKQARLLTAKKGYNGWHHRWNLNEF